MYERSRVRIHDITVPRTTRYALLGAEGPGIEEVWLACHGYGQLASRFIRSFGVLDNGRRLIVAPEALSRFYLSGGTGPHLPEEKVGASWMTREGRDAEIADYVTYLELVRGQVLAGLSPLAVRVVAFGFSQGAAAVCRWAARTASPPDHLVLWGSGVPSDVLEGEARERLARATLTLVVGARDPIADGGRVTAHRKQLDDAGLQYRFATFDGGHEIDGEILNGIAGELSARQ